MSHAADSTTSHWPFALAALLICVGAANGALGAMEAEEGADFDLRRARIKMEGHLFDPRVGFYFEHELSGDRPLLDLRLDVRFSDSFRMRAGQYKVLYNRERVDSSGKQQFVERSIATYAFTLDRQRGITLTKRLAASTRADTELMGGLFEGDGRSPGPRGDEPMAVLRWQWNFLGRSLGFSQSDVALRDVPAASLSLAAATVRGPYTRFSSSGGGQLDGFESGGDERYTLDQWQQGFAWQYRGMSVQQEYHEKRIEDHESGRRSKLEGGYLQFGKLWPVRIASRRRGLELAGRYARVEWRNTPVDRTQTELSLVTNLFITGHDNKLSLDVSRLEVRQPGLGSQDDFRLRIQWDVSL
ncbi:MAG: porin [Gammaproteobacteria bacterium]